MKIDYTLDGNDEINAAAKRLDQDEQDRLRRDAAAREETNRLIAEHLTTAPPEEETPATLF